jgi:hypothetical protein
MLIKEMFIQKGSLIYLIMLDITHLVIIILLITIIIVKLFILIWVAKNIYNAYDLDISVSGVYEEWLVI